MGKKNMCIHVETLNDTETKRVKYIIKKMGIEIPSGILFFMEEEDRELNGILNNIMAKTSEDRVHVYEAKRKQFQLDRVQLKGRMNLNEEKKFIEKFLWNMISKRKGLLQKSVGQIKIFKIYSNKGNVEIKYRIKSLSNATCELFLSLNGYREAVELINDEFRKEFEFFRD